jgi:hypothetical protein
MVGHERACPPFRVRAGTRDGDGSAPGAFGAGYRGPALAQRLQGGVDVKIRFDRWKVAVGTREARALGLLGILGLGSVVGVSRQDEAGARPGLAEVVVGGLPSAPPGLERLVLPSGAGAPASAAAPLAVASFAPVDPVQAGLDHGRLSGVERAVTAEVRVDPASPSTTWRR